MGVPDTGLMMSPKSAAAGAADIVFAETPDGRVAGRLQAFESGCLGLACAQVTSSAWRNRPAALFRQALHAMAVRGIDLAAVRIPADDAAAAQAWREAGAVEIEHLVTLACPLDQAARTRPAAVALADAHDVDACAEIGRRAFQYDRFHADRRIPRQGADNLKAEWMRNNCQGRADAVLVIRSEGRAVGAICCLVSGDDAVIDLVGVLPEAQGRGYGAQLVRSALSHYSGRARRMLVGTQVGNAPSLAMYRRAGFSPLSEKITFHAAPKEIP